MPLTIVPPQDLTGHITRTYPYPLVCGGNGDVFKAMCSTYHVAVKVLRMPDKEVFYRRFGREAAVWNTIKHPNVVQFLGISRDFDRPDMPCMISPWFCHGNILDYLMKRSGVDKWPLVRDIASGLSYLHSQSIIHGDLHASNILINDNGEACITDFGRSRYISAPGNIHGNIWPTTLIMGDGKTRITDVDLSLSLGFGMPGSAIGVQSEWRYHTPELPRDLITLPLNDFSPVTTQGWRWIACELMVDSPDENKHWILRVTKATDVWSFAMTIIEIFTGCVPFSHIKNDASVIVFVTSGGRPVRELCPHINNVIWNMLERCWDTDPARRPSIASLHQFFASQDTLVAGELEWSRL